MSEKWTPDSWRSKPVLQVPDYPDEIELEAVQQKLTAFPPLVFAGEARRLKSDLKKRLVRIAKTTDFIAGQTEFIQSHYREKLKKRLTDVISEQEIDENRLAQEIVYFVDRSDISEEITRLRSHLKQFQTCLDLKGQAIGRRLDFICQEMGREINTVLSKSPLTTIINYLY